MADINTPVRSPADIFAEAAAAAQAQQNAQPAPAPQTPQFVQDLTTALQRSAEAQGQMAARLASLEQRSAPQNMQQMPSDPMSTLERESGIGRDRWVGALAPLVTQAAEQVFETRLGPTLRAGEALNSYAADHEDFDPVEFQKYVAQNPDVAKLVNAASNKGAFETAIEYGETRRKLDVAIKSEARGQARADRRKEIVETTRPDAQVVGMTGSAQPSRNVGNPLTMDQVRHIYAHADAGNWTPFEQAFVNPNLPSEEDFQRLAQS